MCTELCTLQTSTIPPRMDGRTVGRMDGVMHAINKQTNVFSEPRTEKHTPSMWRCDDDERIRRGKQKQQKPCAPRRIHTHTRAQADTHSFVENVCRLQSQRIVTKFILKRQSSSSNDYGDDGGDEENKNKTYEARAHTQTRAQMHMDGFVNCNRHNKLHNRLGGGREAYGRANVCIRSAPATEICCVVCVSGPYSAHRASLTRNNLTKQQN